MGFFSSLKSSRKPPADLDATVTVLQHYFAVSQAVARSWCAQQEARIQVTLPFAAQSCISQLKDSFSEAGYRSDHIDYTLAIHPMKAKVTRNPAIKNIIAVASGKGGVGKSTTSINLACALMQEGARVGLLDADIYGPSLPVMLGNSGARPVSEDGKIMQPLMVHQLQANSIGYLVPDEDAAVWRGPMASRALQQLLNETNWQDLDYLIVDMPPGTGDIQLTLSQQLPVTAAVIVTTPQDLALADAIKGISMFEKVGVPVLGLVENMSYYQCNQCGHKEHIFASGGGEALAQKYATDLLGALPLHISIREHADSGTPLLVSAPDSPFSQEYRQIARNLSMKLALEGEVDEDMRIPVVQKH